MDTQDHMTLLAIGLGLILFSVAALLVQSIVQKRSKPMINRSAPVEKQEAHVPGARFIARPASGKEDPFLRRLEKLA